MNLRLENRLTLRRLPVLGILYVLSGSTYITLLPSLYWLAVPGMLLMVPTILYYMLGSFSKAGLRRGLFAYGFAAFVLASGLVRRDSMGPYFRIALVFLFAYYFTQEFRFSDFRKLYTGFTAAICLIDTGFYFVLQKTGGFSFFPVVTNSNGAGYHIGVLFNYMESHPERNTGIYWEPGLFATMIVLAFVLELLYEERISPWRAVIYHVCIFTTASSAGVVLMLLCDLILLNRLLNRFSDIGPIKYFFFVLLYLLLLAMLFYLDTVLTMTGLTKYRAFAKLLSGNIGGSARLEALVKNWGLFLQHPAAGIGIGEAYRSAANFSDTSTTTFMMVEFGIMGLLPTVFVLRGILGLKRELFENLNLITIFLCILNKEPHMRIAILWVLAFYFSREREAQSASAALCGEKIHEPVAV